MQIKSKRRRKTAQHRYHNLPGKTPHLDKRAPNTFARIVLIVPTWLDSRVSTNNCSYRRPVARPRAEGGQSCWNLGPKNTPQKKTFHIKYASQKISTFPCGTPLLTLGFRLPGAARTENLKVFSCFEPKARAKI